MKPLSDCSVLIVEEDFAAGLELMRALSDEGCRGVKLVRTIEGALQELAAESPDVATLNPDVHGKASTPVADLLAAHDIPFVVVSRTSPGVVTALHRDRPVCQKPVAASEMVSLLAGAVHHRKAA